MIGSLLDAIAGPLTALAVAIAGGVAAWLYGKRKERAGAESERQRQREAQKEANDDLQRRLDHEASVSDGDVSAALERLRDRASGR